MAKLKHPNSGKVIIEFDGGNAPINSMEESHIDVDIKESFSKNGITVKNIKWFHW